MRQLSRQTRRPAPATGGRQPRRTPMQQPMQQGGTGRPVPQAMPQQHTPPTRQGRTPVNRPVPQQQGPANPRGGYQQNQTALDQQYAADLDASQQPQVQEQEEQYRALKTVSRDAMAEAVADMRARQEQALEDLGVENDFASYKDAEGDGAFAFLIPEGTYEDCVYERVNETTLHKHLQFDSMQVAWFKGDDVVRLELDKPIKIPMCVKLEHLIWGTPDGQTPSRLMEGDTHIMICNHVMGRTRSGSPVHRFDWCAGGESTPWVQQTFG